MERIDTTITNILNTATKKVEGIKRNIPYFMRKKYGDLNYCIQKWCLGKTGKIVGTDIINWRKSITGIINEEELDVEMINNKIQAALVK